MNLRRIVLATCLAATVAAARPASAQWGDGCYGGCGFGGYWDIGRLYAVLSQNVPYYAAFPPVYYSYPVPRTYGYSPFAYPPGVMTPEVELIEPLTINNPYVKGVEISPAVGEKQAEPAAPVDRTTSAPRPQTILNPFVTDSAYAQR